MSLQTVLKTFDQAWNSVRLGEHSVKEFILYSFDVPLRKNFIPESCTNFNERARRVMMSHHVFRKLSDNLQAQIWKRNAYYGAAITCSKLEACNSGLEQATVAFNNIDKEYVENEFPTFDIQSLKKLTLMQSNKISKVLVDKDAMRYHDLVQEIGAIIHDETTFKLFMLLFMFSDFDHIEEIRMLKSNYLNLFLRRKGMSFQTECPDVQNAIGRDYYCSLSSCVRKVKELTKIMMKMGPPK